MAAIAMQTTYLSTFGSGLWVMKPRVELWGEVRRDRFIPVHSGITWPDAEAGARPSNESARLAVWEMSQRLNADLAREIRALKREKPQNMGSR
jgi:hypothetical protein